MAKLDKIRFARVVEYISSLIPQHHINMQTLDDLIDIDIPVMGVEPINEMLNAIKSCKKIDAIKHYRAMTGASLMDAKRAIEIVL